MHSVLKISPKKTFFITISFPVVIFFNFFRANKSEKGAEKSGSGINDYVTSLFDQTLTWKDITWLKTLTHLPIVVKGILHPEDALIAIGNVQLQFTSRQFCTLDGVL